MYYQAFVFRNGGSKRKVKTRFFFILSSAFNLTLKRVFLVKNVTLCFSKLNTNKYSKFQEIPIVHHCTPFTNKACSKSYALNVFNGTRLHACDFLMPKPETPVLKKCPQKKLMCFAKQELYTSTFSLSDTKKFVY